MKSAGPVIKPVPLIRPGDGLNQHKVQYSVRHLKIVLSFSEGKKQSRRMRVSFMAYFI